MERLEFTVSPEQAGRRVDVVLAGCAGDLTRSGLQRLIAGGALTLNGAPVLKSCKLAEGDRVVLLLPDPVEPEAQPQDIPLCIVYEDDALLVVNKPRGMVVHPAAGNQDGTLVNALLYHCRGRLSSINGVIRPGIVHRIDKDTSGLLVVAKTDEAHQGLARQIAAHSMLREYRAVVHGTLPQESGRVEAPIGRHPVERKRMAVTARGSKEAVTHYQVLGRYQGFSYLSLRLETGRTHQIRVHMAYIGHPVAGDPVYGPKKTALAGGQCLHAKTIGFTHPLTGERLTFDSELPDYFQKFLSGLRPMA